MYIDKFNYRYKQHGYSFFYKYWREVLFEYACKIFTYTGTLAEIIPQKEIEKRVLLFGKCGVNYSDDNTLIACDINLFGITHYYDQFTSYNYSTPLECGEREIGATGVVIDNNSTRNSIQHIIHAYACQLAHAEVTLITAFINDRDTVAWTAISDKMAETAREYRAKMYEGKIDVCVDKGFSTLEMRNLATDKRQSYTELYDVRNNILNSYLELIGVRRSNEKRERLVTNEVSANNSLLKLNLRDMYECRKKGMDEVYRLFGVRGEVVCNVDIDGDGEIDSKEVEGGGNNE